MSTQLHLFDPDAPEPRPNRDRIRSDAATVNRHLAALEQRKQPPVPTPYGTRHYHNGPHANPGWVCQGGLPSLGEGYS